MPCRYDESEGEIARREASELLEFACKELKIRVPTGDTVVELCALLKELDERQRDRVVYNAKKAKSRRLADWWEDHVNNDKRIAADKAKKKQDAKLRKAALAKLTAAERRALGV